MPVHKNHQIGILLSLAFFACFAIAVLHAHHQSALEISVAVTEWGHIFAFIIITAPFFFPWWNNALGKLVFCCVCRIYFSLDTGDQSTYCQRNKIKGTASKCFQWEGHPDSISFKTLLQAHPIKKSRLMKRFCSTPTPCS